MGESATGKPARLLKMLGLLAAGLATDFGLGLAQGKLGSLTSALRFEKGTGFFYADAAYWLVHQALAGFEVVFYTAALLALAGAFARPLLQRRRLRQKRSVGRLAAAAQRHPVVAERVLPWAAGFGWLGLAMFGESAFTFLGMLGWDLGNPGHASFGMRLHYLLESSGRALTRATDVGYLVGSVAAVVGIAMAVRYGARRLMQDPEAPAPVPEPLSDKGSFAAVAVTPATQGAVAGLVLLSLAVAVFAVKAESLYTLGPVVFAYILAALGTATLFRRMSRIVVGIDGILVLGADKTRFFGYAGLDGVKASGSDILLQRGQKTALRLQLHDDDVTRAPALADRIRAAMDHAVRMRGEGADRLLHATSGSSAAASRKLAHGSRGGLDYRQPAIAREQLWQLVEGPVSDAGARRVAAEALAPDMNREERERLRVAADKCAEPRARVALRELLAEEREDETDEVEPAIVPRRRFS